MTPNELMILLQTIQKTKSETQTLEIKAAYRGCPEKLYDTLSSFSNQDDGGTIVFGVDEKNNFAECGVYDAQDLQKHVVEQCNQMTPQVRPLFTVLDKDEKLFVSAEIPGIDISDRPCFYSGKGRVKGSYVRVADADEPMTEYEVYSFEAFRKKYHDDIRPIQRASMNSIDSVLLEDYLFRVKKDKPNFAQLDNDTVLELLSITHEGVPTLAAELMFGKYPQAFAPQLSIIAIVIPGTEMGELSDSGARFIDNKRIEGTLPQMLNDALRFVQNNTKTSTSIDPKTGKRTDKNEYPMVAVREALLNALIHRDYSIHTEGMPIQLLIFSDRLEIRNPGGLYGRLSIDQLGKTQPDTRNPVIALAMETLKETENRYSGIPTIRRELSEAGMPAPQFINQHGTFAVCFRKSNDTANMSPKEKILQFCTEYRSRSEIANMLGIKTETYAMKQFVTPLVEEGVLELELPEKPKSTKQRYRVKS